MKVINFLGFFSVRPDLFWILFKSIIKHERMLKCELIMNLKLIIISVCLFVCDGSLMSGQLIRALSRLPQGSSFQL